MCRTGPIAAPRPAPHRAVAKPVRRVKHIDLNGTVDPYPRGR